MVLFTILLAGYTSIGLVFFDQTYREGENFRDGKVGGWDFARVAGLALCILWPLLLVYVIVMSYKTRHSN